MSSLNPFQLDVVSNLEFLKEGAAIEDFMRPNRVVIGEEEVGIVEIIKELDVSFTLTGAPSVFMDRQIGPSFLFPGLGYGWIMLPERHPRFSQRGPRERSSSETDSCR